MFSRILIANRGEIAVRIVRACHSMGIDAVVAYSEADRDSRAVQLADEAICVGPAEMASVQLPQRLHRHVERAPGQPVKARALGQHANQIQRRFAEPPIAVQADQGGVRIVEAENTLEAPDLLERAGDQPVGLRWVRVMNLQHRARA